MFQIRYNRKYRITPKTIIKSVSEKEGHIKGVKHLGKSEIARQIIDLEARMREAAEKLEFEKAIELRDALEGMKVASINKDKERAWKDSKKKLNL